MDAFLVTVLRWVEGGESLAKINLRRELTAFDGTVLRQDLRDIWVSGTSEVSGVAGDGEREQAVTEEEDMVTLCKGKGGMRYGLCLSDSERQLPNQIQRVRRSGLKDKMIFR